ETLITEMWQVAPNKIVFRVKVAERGEYVINNAAVELNVSVSSTSNNSTNSNNSGVVLSGTGQKCESIFNSLASSGSPDLVSKINATFLFTVKGGTDSNKVVNYLLNMKSGSGSVSLVESNT